MITAKNISLAIQGKKILHDVSFEIPKGQLAFFIGPSGAGKTSLLKCLGKLHSFEGTIFSEGKIGFVFQQFYLFPHMTVAENCTHPLETTLKWSPSKAKEKAAAMLSLFGIQELEKEYPTKLSGGQQQRLALARAMCLEPQVLLFDEPTASLDPENTHNLIKMISVLQKGGVTMVISTHDLNLLKQITGTIHFVEQGKIVESFDPELDQMESKPKIHRFFYGINVSFERNV